MALSSEQQQEIQQLQAEGSATRRVTSSGLEQILYKPFPVLDHGFVRVIDYMGDDSAVVQAARVSYGRGTKKSSEDKGLIHYLLRHRHTTPFEMCEIKFHVKLPIFVAREWIRHRTANVNEYSARYSIMNNEFYVPPEDKLGTKPTLNRQGRGPMIQGDEAAYILRILQEDAQQAYTHYEEMLNETASGERLDPHKVGLARELARMNLTLNFYTEWYWKIDLHNLMHFLKLRASPNAQWEIQAYAQVMMDILKCWVPHTFEAFERYVLYSMHLSQQGIDAVKKLIRGQPITQASSGMSPREWREFCDALEIPEDDDVYMKAVA